MPIPHSHHASLLTYLHSLFPSLHPSLSSLPPLSPCRVWSRWGQWMLTSTRALAAATRSRASPPSRCLAPTSRVHRTTKVRPSRTAGLCVCVRACVQTSVCCLLVAVMWLLSLLHAATATVCEQDLPLQQMLQVAQQTTTKTGSLEHQTPPVRWPLNGDVICITM